MSLSNVQEVAVGLSTPAWRAILAFWDVLPLVLWGVLLILFGYIFAKLLEYLIYRGLAKTALEKWWVTQGYSKAVGGIEVGKILASFVKWYVLALFLIEGFRVMNLSSFSQILLQLALWLPGVIVGVFIVFVGLIVAQLVEKRLLHLKKLEWVVKILPIIKFLIIVLFVDIALSNAGISIVLAQNTFLIIVGGLVLTLALVIGISFGFALRNEASGLLKGLISKKNQK
jgi:hypothetical protein